MGAAWERHAMCESAFRNRNSAHGSCGCTAVLCSLLTGSGASTVQVVSEIVSSSPQQSKRQGDPSPPPRANVKDAWIYTSNHPYVFRARYLNTFCIHLWRNISDTNKIGFNNYGLPPCIYTANQTLTLTEFWASFTVLFSTLMTLQPKAGHGLLILHAVSRSHTTTHHNR